MSEGYASRLSEYKDKGVCGLPEIFDSKRAITTKVRRLVELIENASQVVVITGAGISTSAGIPDFRSPYGVWTKEKEDEKAKKNSGRDDKESPSKKRKLTQREEPKRLENFAAATPTLCHRAITKLVSLGKIQYCITQNVDGLHRRAGLKRDKHSSVHGCVFTEKCETCGAEFFRDFDVGGMSFRPTGRSCTMCDGGILRDTLLDWEDALPVEDLERAEHEIEKPGTLVLCLGTSLRIEPVGSLPLKANKFVIVNLQRTPIDDEAALIIRGPVDDVMHEVMVTLGYPAWQKEVPPPIERVWVPQVAPEPSSTTSDIKP